MCGRATLVEPRLIAEAFDIHEPLPEITVRYNIAPTDPIATIRVPHRLELLTWGIRRDRGQFQINTKVETIAKTVNSQRRCVVLVDGFYEWKRLDEKTKQPMWFHHADGSPFAFGGTWSKTTTSDGEIIEGVTILTRTPIAPVAEVHDRMPLILPRAVIARWLGTDGDVTDLLASNDTQLIATPVSPYVNSPKNDDAKCIEPFEVTPTQGALF